jgi:hypothetical protein
MRWLAVAVTLSFCLVLATWANDKGSKQGAASAARPIDGEQVYKSNCTRCHNTPPTLTERQTRVVVRHMRVRANIPADQADAALQYLSETARRD